MTGKEGERRGGGSKKRGLSVKSSWTHKTWVRQIANFYPGMNR